MCKQPPSLFDWWNVNTDRLINKGRKNRGLECITCISDSEGTFMLYNTVFPEDIIEVIILLGVKSVELRV